MMLQSIKNAVFRAATRLFPCDLRDTIIVTGSPRSGTTWLSELLRELPGYKMLNEPLNLNSSVLARDVDRLEWRTHLLPETAAPEVEDLLHRALTGRVAAPHMWRFRASTAVGRLVETVMNRNLVVKLIRAGRMLPWFSKRFPVRTIVSIFRHPCAVVASQMNYQDTWQGADPPAENEIQTGFGGELPDVILDRHRSTLSQIDSTAGYLAAVWSLDTHMALQGPIHGRWIVTTYEDLVEGTEAQMNRLLQSLNEPMPMSVKGRFDTPSNSAAEDLKAEDSSAQLTKWKRALTDAQIDAILRVVHAFGLDFYTASPRPQQEKLKRRANEARHDSFASPSPVE